MATGPGIIRRAWYQWKMMRFPWRKKWLVGFDLYGNTFWESKDVLHSLRNRRTAKYSRSTHYSDVNISPPWMQWLRYTRFDPPSLFEQEQDIMRQERMKVLAARADAKWAFKPSALDSPEKQQPPPMLQSSGKSRAATSKAILQNETTRGRRPRSASELEPSNSDQKAPSLPNEPKNSPRKRATTNSSGDWQPEGWVAAPAKRRS